jgi:endoglucanase
MSTQTLSQHNRLATVPGMIGAWIVRYREHILVALLLLTAGVAHGFNMFSFPYYESDEGAYIAQAWAVVTLGELAPYTYWYDHAPAGWLQIAAWVSLTGGFHAFGSSINTGRVLMLLMQIGSTLMVYMIVRALLQPREQDGQAAKRAWEIPAIIAASIAVLVLAFSVYGLYYRRRVLLDNIATFWMLLSIVLLVHGRLSLTRVWASAAALAISVLSKELTIFLFPPLVCLVWYRAHSSQRWLASIGWTAIVGAIVSLYVLMAALKGELFPSGTWLGGNSEHVSLIETLQFHSGRGKDGGLLEADSNFWVSFLSWLKVETLLVGGGLVAMTISLLMTPWRPVVGLLAMANVMLWLFLGRGGVVFDFYLVPLLPLLAINIGVVVGLASGWMHLGLLRLFAGMRGPRSARAALASLWLVVPLATTVGATMLTIRSFREPAYTMLENPMALWASPQADVQQLAVEWARYNLPAESRIVIDQAMWLDMREETATGAVFPHAHYYWKVDKDPEIYQGVFGGRRDNADYIITTSQLHKDVSSDVLPLVTEILIHSTPVISFDTSGWPVEVRKVHRLYPDLMTEEVLGRTWESYKSRFIVAGRVIDPGRDGDTTSEGQSYALLRAVYKDHRTTFNTVWAWTRANLQRPDGLFAWLYSERAGAQSDVLATSSATDADQDIALALLLASRRWAEPAYQAEALPILAAIWEHETTIINGMHVLVAGDWARGGEGQPAIINPSYFAPYAYRIFEEADPARPWGALVESTYILLHRFSLDDRLGARTGLLPTWVAADVTTGALEVAEGMEAAGEFSYDGLRAPWRLTLDWLWYHEPRSLLAVERFRGLGRIITRDGKVAAAYTMDGTPQVEYESIAMYAGVVPALLFGGYAEAWQVYDQGIQASFVDEGHRAYWGDPDNYYDQNWAWFTTALLDGTMGNLWRGEERLVWDGLIVP